MISFFRNPLGKYLKNTSWILGEKILRLVAGLFVGILVARHLGPEKYGTLNYALALSSLFAVATHMGLSGLVVRELVRKPSEAGLTLGTTFSIKFAISILTSFAFVIFALSTEKLASTEFWLLIIVSSIILLKPFEVLNFWFESKVQAKYSSMANGAALICSSCLKAVLVITGAQLLSFAFAHILEAAVMVLLFVIFYKNSAGLSFREWSTSSSKAKELLSQSWMILLGALFATIYLRVDQIMLKWLVSADEVGVYAVAAKLSEVWYFVPTAIVSSFFPKLIVLKKQKPVEFQKRLQQLFDFLFILALLLALTVTFSSEFFISILYGSAYAKSGIVLSVHIWAGLFIFMRAALSKWILTENVLVFSLISQASGALMNVILNLILIRQHQSLGAAVATLVSYGFASYVSLLFYKKSRPVFWMMSKSFLAPARYCFHLIKKV